MILLCTTCSSFFHRSRLTSGINPYANPQADLTKWYRIKSKISFDRKMTPRIYITACLTIPNCNPTCPCKDNLIGFHINPIKCLLNTIVSRKVFNRYINQQSPILFTLFIYLRSKEENKTEIRCR